MTKLYNGLGKIECLRRLKPPFLGKERERYGKNVRPVDCVVLGAGGVGRLIRSSGVIMSVGLEYSASF